MTYACKITGKKPQVGNRVSHANNKTKHRFMPNIRKKRFWVESEKRWVTLRVSARGIRYIDKHGIESALQLLKEVQE